MILVKPREPSDDSTQQQGTGQQQQLPTDTEMSDESKETGPRTDDYNRIEFSMNEQTYISLLLAILANMLIDFSPCKEVSLIWHLNKHVQSKKKTNKKHCLSNIHCVDIDQ